MGLRRSVARCWPLGVLLLCGVVMAEPAKAGKAAGDSRQKLDPAQINVIKVWEIDLSVEPTIQVPKDVVNELLDTYRGHEAIPKGKRAQAMFRSSPGHRKLETIFAVKAREYYDRVVVRSDPPALRYFRKSVHAQYVLNYCGTVRCHGGPDAGRLELFRDRVNSDETVYTNFYLMHSMNVDGEQMINRHEPDRSLLLTYGLPAADTSFPHPEVPGWRQALADTEARRYELIKEWIVTLFPDPDYRIKYPSRPDSDEDAGDVDP